MSAIGTAPDAAFDAAVRTADAVAAPLAEAERLANRYQWLYRWCAVTASLLGAAGLLLAVGTLVWESGESNRIVSGPLLSNRTLLIAEVVLAVSALAVVLFGLFADVKGGWLRERNKAERLKLLRSRYLIDPTRWTDADGRFQTELADIRAESPDVTNWVKQQPVPVFAASSVDDAQLLERLLRYYLTERLEGQIAFFRSRAQAFERRLAWVRPFPVLLFYLSFVGVAVDATLQAVAGDSPQVKTAIALLAAAALGLPVVSAAMRTIVLSRELARNSSRYAAKLHALTHLNVQLNVALKEIQSGVTPDRGAAILRDLSCCEYLLESDHREWIRLMVEAEWY
jgi:hypothetical protein